MSKLCLNVIRVNKICDNNPFCKVITSQAYNTQYYQLQHASKPTTILAKGNNTTTSTLQLTNALLSLLLEVWVVLSNNKLQSNICPSNICPVWIQQSNFKLATEPNQNLANSSLGEASKQKIKKIWDNVPIRVDPPLPPTFGAFLNFIHFLLQVY